jgi:hypothetical protein
MSRGNLDFAGEGAFSFLARGYVVTPPSDVDLASDRALRHPNSGVVLVAVLDRLRRGQRDALHYLLDRCVDDEHPVISVAAHRLIGHAGTPALLLRLVEHARSRLEQPGAWWSVLYTCEALLESRFVWAVPLVLDLYADIAARTDARKELGIIPIRLDAMLRPPQPDGGSLYSAYSGGRDGDLVREALTIWQGLRDQHGPDAIVWSGRPFDLRDVVEPLRRLATAEGPDAGIHQLREIYESATGRDCSNWYAQGQPRRLQIAAEAERFLAEDAHRFPPGIRYLFGHPLVDPPDPRAHDWMNAGVVRLQVEHPPTTPAALDEDDDRFAGRDEFFYAHLTELPANPHGSAWERLAAVGQDAWLGKFDRVAEHVLAARELIGHDYHFDLYAARLLADAAPSSQLRATLERLRTRVHEVRDPSWQEFMLVALGGSKLGWALSEAVEILLVFSADRAEYGPAWDHLRPALRPESTVEENRASREPSAALRERVASNVAAHPRDRALFEGELLSLRTLVDRLADELAREPVRLAAVMDLRHLLETMTGIDLSRLWLDGEHVDPVGGQAVIAELRASPLVQTHEAGTRWFFGHRIPE